MIYIFASIFILSEIFIFLLGFNFSYQNNIFYEKKSRKKEEYTLININLLKHMTIMFNIFISEYIVISGILLMFDLFRVWYVLAISFFINFIIMIFVILKNKFDFKNLNFNLKWDSLLVVILIGFMLPFCWSKFETIMPNQDQGVYGLKAIDLMYGDTKSQKELKEYNILKDSEEDKKSNLEFFRVGKLGLYTFDTENKDEYHYEYHALPAFPAYMAFFGKCFGLTKIIYSLTPIFILFCLNVYFIVKKYAVIPNAELLAVFLAGFSPVAIYLAKISLTELIYSYLIVSGILMFIHKNRVSIIFSIIPLASLGFIHMVTITYVPLIFFIGFILGVRDKNKDYFIWNIIYNIFYVISFIYAQRVSKAYFAYQIGEIFGGIDLKICFWIVIGFCFILCLIDAISMFLFKTKFFMKGIELFQKHSIYILKAFLILIIAVVIIKGFLLGFTDYFQPGDGMMRHRTNYLHGGIRSFLFLHFTTIIMETSYIAVPYIIYRILKRNSKFNNEVIMFGFIFIYSLAVYNILRADAPILYYCARYLFYLIVPASVILFSIIASKRIIIIAMLVCFITAMPFNIATLKVHAENGAIEILQDSLNIIEPGAIIIMDKNDDYLGYLHTCLRETNENLVFEKSSFEKVIEKFPDKKIYFISGDPKNTPGRILFDKVYENMSGKYDSFNGMYPTEVYVFTRRVIISLYS